MSVVSEIITGIGQDNFQGIIAILVTTLLGKSSWDIYTSKTLAKRADVDESVLSLKKEIQAEIDSARNQIDEARKDLSVKLDKEVLEAKKDVTAILKKLNSAEEKLNSLETKAQSLTESVKGTLESIIEKPRISRAEARRIKEDLP